MDIPENSESIEILPGAPAAPAQPFRLNPPISGPLGKALFPVARPFLERVFGLHELSRLYETSDRSQWEPAEFPQRVLQLLNISYSVSDEDLLRIPEKGRVLVVSNHPFGGIEGVILLALLRSYRADIRVMANFLLSRIPELRDFFLFVDPFGSSDSKTKNINPLRDTLKWLQEDGILGVFPAGTVSHLHWQHKDIRDPEWSVTVARIIRRTRSPVLPVFFHGNNGLFFQLMGLLHPRLRTLLLPNELLNKRNTTISLNIGNLIPFEKLESFEEDADMLAYLRLRTHILASGIRRSADQPLKGILPPLKRKKLFQQVVPPENSAAMYDEISRLPKDNTLLESGNLKAIFARAWQVPTVLREIGRLRELTFRSASEGTGLAIDLDRFDEFYVHLFVWNSEKHEVVGAYRIGQTDKIVEQFGKSGLYTSTLFAYSSELLAQLGPSLELGRSFVRQEYQKSYSPLLLLWKGIGQFVVRNPKYKTLFGPVSINNDYDSVSRDIIVNFLQANDYLPELAKLVTPRNPLRIRPMDGFDPKGTSVVVRNIEEVSELVAEIEEDKRGIPVLLRQYLKVGGKLIGFNVDPGFGDVLDGLILVDLTQTEPKLRERYLGKEGNAIFMQHHELAAKRKNLTPISSAKEKTPNPTSSNNPLRKKIKQIVRG